VRILSIGLNLGQLISDVLGERFRQPCCRFWMCQKVEDHLSQFMFIIHLCLANRHSPSLTTGRDAARLRAL